MGTVEYGNDGQAEVCVCANGKQSKSFYVCAGPRQGCVASHLLFIFCMNRMDKLSQTDESVTIGRCKIRRMLFADDLILVAFFEFEFQNEVNGFVAVCAML